MSSTTPKSNILIRIIEHKFTPYLVTLVFALFMISPIILMLLNSFKSIAEAFAWPPTIFPTVPTFETYLRVLRSAVPLTMRNSVMLSLITTSLVLAIALPTAYALSKYPFRGSKIVLLFYLASRIVPPVSLLVPFYIMLSTLRLIDTHLGLILVYTYITLPIIIWVIKGFFDEFPKDLIDSALVDGCTRLGAFIRIVLPTSAVGVAASGIITFLWCWNEFLFPMVFTTSNNVAPLTTGVFEFVGDEVIEWSSLSAVGIFASLPAIIFFIFAQKYIIAGLTKGALKL
ncbi:MAG: carbohydrate ABC transporter permease [Nitrososphaeria archaeon]|nr:carbohydrate ABC transporter permease [Nitrososphaeria archaeon]